MKLRFRVNQAECFRRGIDCPKSIVVIEVDPAKLTQPDRNLIADHLDGIDVTPNASGGDNPTMLLMANGPELKDLMQAIRAFVVAQSQPPTVDPFIGHVLKKLEKGTGLSPEEASVSIQPPFEIWEQLVGVPPDFIEKAKENGVL